MGAGRGSATSASRAETSSRTVDVTDASSSSVSTVLLRVQEVMVVVPRVCRRLTT
jgi:hypothetical protein